MRDWYQANASMFLKVNSFRYAGLYTVTLMCSRERDQKQPVDEYLGRKRRNLRTRKQRQNMAAHLALKYCREKYGILTIFLKIYILGYFDWRTYITAQCIKWMKHLSLDAEENHSNGKKLYFLYDHCSFQWQMQYQARGLKCSLLELEHPWWGGRREKRTLKAGSRQHGGELHLGTKAFSLLTRLWVWSFREMGLNLLSITYQHWN